MKKKIPHFLHLVIAISVKTNPDNFRNESAYMRKCKQLSLDDNDLLIAKDYPKFIRQSLNNISIKRWCNKHTKKSHAVLHDILCRQLFYIEFHTVKVKHLHMSLCNISYTYVSSQHLVYQKNVPIPQTCGNSVRNNGKRKILLSTLYIS